MNLPPIRRRRRRSDPRQMEFAFEVAAKPYRAIVLDVVESATEFRTARNIAATAGLTYPQTIFALLALFNNGKIARQGSKFTAMWGPLRLERKPDSGFDTLQSLFNLSVRPK